MKWSSQKAVLFEVAMIKLYGPVIETEKSTNMVNPEVVENLEGKNN